MNVISGREASIFACLTDTVLAPTPLLPHVRDTDTVASFDRWLAHSPRLNRLGLRALVYLAELAPALLGSGCRLRRLPEEDRAAFLERAERSAHPAAWGIVKLVKGLTSLSYYGDDEVMRGLGYDAEANVRRGRELRAREGRP